MKKNNDYKVYIRQDGTRFYCKGKGFHRENGPAIVFIRDKDKYPFLPEDNIYEEITCTYMQLARISVKLKKIPTEVMTTKAESRYFLDNVEYSKQEFDALKLNDELQINLPLNIEPISSKKLKI